MSIVIPTLNEEGTIAGTLRSLQHHPPPVETIVVDGGSTDGTREAARAAGASVLEASRGRGPQLNRGAEAAEGDLLLFLHADTTLPPDGLTRVRRVLGDTPAVAGTFRLQFDAASPLLHFYAWCTWCPWIRLCFGDRGLFTTRPAFEAVGGYPEWPLFEDLELADRLQDHGRFRFLDTAVTTSARRFRRNGVLRQQLQNLYLWTHYVAGTDPDRLAHRYRYPDPSPPHAHAESAD